MTIKDTLYRKPQSPPKAFTFDARVAKVFDDMATRSIPGYNEVQHLTTIMARQYTKSRTRIYDVGCSTGNTLILLLHAIRDKSIDFIGADPSPEMLAICGRKIGPFAGRNRTALLASPAEDLTFENASVIIFNYTLQFVEPRLRSAILKRAFTSLVKGGVLILSEKTNPLTKDRKAMQSFYRQFKLDNGYSNLEIDQKDSALTGILRPFSEEKNISLLTGAGFKNVMLMQKSLQFCSFAAIK